MTKDVTKKYRKDDINIVWKPNLCMHSENCWRGLSAVFNPDERPWINPEGASKEEIIAQVGKCPSGALSIEQIMEEEGNEVDHPSVVQIEVAENGPLLLKGDFKIKSKGEDLEVSKMAALCRCGGSSHKPFCDGSHRKIDFRG